MNRLLLAKLAKLRNVSVERTTTLRQRVNTTEPDRAWIAQALEELDVAQEELRVTEEELRIQSAELSAVYGALDRDRRRYRELFDGAPEPSLVTDAEGVVHEANRLACQLLGLEPRFLMGKPLDVFVWPDDKPRARALLRDIGRTSEVLTFNLRLKPRGAAEARAVSIKVRRTRGDDERALAIHWILREL
jgi:PAS domain S-box-containing protein